MRAEVNERAGGLESLIFSVLRINGSLLWSAPSISVYCRNGVTAGKVFLLIPPHVTSPKGSML